MGCAENRDGNSSKFPADFPGTESIPLPAKLVDKLIRKYTTGADCSEPQFLMITKRLKLQPLSKQRRAFYACMKTEDGYDSLCLLVSGILHSQSIYPDERLQLLFETVDNALEGFVSAEKAEQLFSAMLAVSVSYPLQSFTLSDEERSSLQSLDSDSMLLEKVKARLCPKSFLRVKDFVQFAEDSDVREITTPSGFRRFLRSEALTHIPASLVPSTEVSANTLSNSPQLDSPDMERKKKRRRRRNVTERGRETSEYIRRKATGLV